MVVVLLVAAVLAGAYVLGGLPTAAIVGRRAGFDPASAGSHNPGASNSFRLGGAGAGAAVLAGDLAQGAAAAAIGLATGGRALGVAAGASAVMGHVAPIARRFRGGGKGVATTLGAVAVLDPLAAGAGVVAWLVVVAATRTAAIASVVMLGVLVAAIAVSGRSGWEVLALGGVAAIVVLRHHDNLARLRRGEEHSLDPKGSP